VAVYTDITDAELTAFLADFDLGAPVSFKGIAEGVENSNFLLETERGRFIVTVYERRTREEDLPYFVGLMRWLAEKGYPCPTPIFDRQGRALKRIRGKPACMVSFLNGLSVRRPNAVHCRQAGVGLARLHLAGAGFDRRRPNDLGQAAWAGLFERQSGSADRLKPGLAGLIETDLDALAAAWPRDLPAGVIHADFFPDNVFFSSERFAAAIDFYFACDDAFAYDLGVCLNAWCFEPDGSFNVTRARALVAGYQSERTLTPAERDALPVLARGSAMRFFLTRLIDWERGAAGALVRPKDPMEYEKKLSFHRSAESVEGPDPLNLFEADR
jgi:homoserine kinase type II